MGLVILAVNRLLGEKYKNPFVKAFAAFAMSTGWRVMYVLYLLLLVPDWIREVSVISSAEKLIPFFITQNLMVSGLLFVGYQFREHIFKPIQTAEHKISAIHTALPARAATAVYISAAAVMLCANIVLELLL